MSATPAFAMLVREVVTEASRGLTTGEILEEARRRGAITPAHRRRAEAKGSR